MESVVLLRWPYIFVFLPYIETYTIISPWLGDCKSNWRNNSMLLVNTIVRHIQCYGSLRLLDYTWVNVHIRDLAIYVPSTTFYFLPIPPLPV